MTQSVGKIATKSSEPGLIEQIDIFSNKTGKSVSLANGLISFTYVESIMNDTIKVNLSFIDSGNTIDNKNIIEGLPLVGQERVILKFTDNNKNTLGGQPELVLYVNKITPTDSKTQKSIISLELVSKESILNQKIRITKRLDGKISDHVKTILTSQDYLKTQKKVEVEDTINNFNFFGNNKKSFYTINWLSKKAVSAKSQKLGESAGYIFYETSEGFFFKSIDSLLDEKTNPPKLKLLYNETPDVRGQNIPPGYDQKILRFQKMNNVNVQEKLKMGTFTNRTVLFDPFTCYYEVKTVSPGGDLKTGGKELFLDECRNKEFDIQGQNKEFSRTQYFLLDKGTAPTGNADQQIEKSGEENFEYGQIANQSMMRYNQLYSMRVNITIAGNLSLHAGDAIYLDFPGLEQKNTFNLDNRDGGLYIITDICHSLDTEGTFTECNLVRDSYGRKPLPR